MMWYILTYTIPVAVPVVVVTTVRVTSIGLTDLANRHTKALSQLSIAVMAVSVNPTSTKQGGREGKYHDQKGAKDNSRFEMEQGDIDNAFLESKH